MVAIVGRLIAAAAGALVGAAVARELDKPSEQREWHGEVGGVPYDFRRPNIDKLVRSAWDPNNPAVIVPPVFGIGWGVNFARVAEWIQPPSAPATGSGTAAPALEGAPAAPALPAGETPVPAAAPPVDLPAVDSPASPAVATPATPVVDTPPTPGVAAPSTAGVATSATSGVAAPVPPALAVDKPAESKPATPATPAGPTDATGDSQG
jgi:hypothetical protein